MISEQEISSVAAVIQIAIAPVFLLAGISALLAVMTNRLTRVIDRWRTLERALAKMTDKESQRILEKEMKNQFKRGRYINVAITLATVSALLVCAVIVSLFLGTFFGKNATLIIAALFICCMCVLIFALGFFLAEVLIATRTLRKGLYTIESLIHFDKP